MVDSLVKQIIEGKLGKVIEEESSSFEIRRLMSRLEKSIKELKTTVMVVDSGFTRLVKKGIPDTDQIDMAYAIEEFKNELDNLFDKHLKKHL